MLLSVRSVVPIWFGKEVDLEIALQQLDLNLIYWVADTK